MSFDTALPEAQKLRNILLAKGVPEVSIELQEGRPSPSADDWNNQFCVTDMSHHTVSNYSSTRLTPCLSLIKNGRGNPGDSNYLPGPLANGYGGWDLCFRIITLGYANHPGAGGPITVPGGYTIPKDSARRYAFGVEYEGGINLSDWDKVLQNPRGKGKAMTFREFMGRCNAAIHEMYDLPDGAHLEHSTWAPNRKVDRLKYTQASGVIELSRYTGATITPGPEAERPRNSLGQLSMSYKAIITSLDQEVSDSYKEWRDWMWATMAALGLCPRPTEKNQAEFRHDWYTAVEKLHATQNQYAFDYLVDRAGYWPPDNNDWPPAAWDHKNNVRS